MLCWEAGQAGREEGCQKLQLPGRPITPPAATEGWVRVGKAARLCCWLGCPCRG